MSPTMVRMKIASSQIRTVWLTPSSLREQNLGNQCIEIEDDDRGVVDHRESARHPAARAYWCGIFVDRERPNVQHFVDDDADDPLAAVLPNEENRTVVDRLTGFVEPR